MLPVFERYALALSEDVGFKRLNFLVVVRQWLTTNGVLDAPVNHVAEQRDPSQLDLVLRVSLRVRVRRIRMAHVTRDANRTAERLSIMEDAIAFLDKLVDRCLPDLLVSLAELLVHVTRLYLGRTLPAFNRFFHAFSPARSGSLGNLQLFIPVRIRVFAPPLGHQRIGDLLRLLPCQ